MPQYDAKLVRGTNSLGTSERLATEANQSTAVGYLNLLVAYLATVMGSFISDLFGRQEKFDAGILCVGSYYGEDNSMGAVLKFQTQNIQNIEMTESALIYNIDKVSDSDKYIYAEIIDINISGFNYSPDTRLLIKYYSYRADINTYDIIWENAIEYGMTDGLAFNTSKTFKTVPLADWDRDESRYGYIEITPLGTQTATSFVLDVQIIINPIT